MKDRPFDIRELLGPELVNMVNRLPDKQPRDSVNFSESGFSGWTVREEAHGEGELDRFVISSGLPRFDVRITRQSVILDWSAKLPEALSRGLGVDEFYDKFLPLITRDLPNKMLLNLSQEPQTVARYRQSTKVVLGFSNGQEALHTIASERNAALLAFDIFTNQGSLQSLRILAGYGQGDFVLSANYGRNEDTMGLILPLSERGIKSYTGAMAEWLLGTNRMGKDLGSLTEPAARLADVLRSRAQGALDNRNPKSL